MVSPVHRGQEPQSIPAWRAKAQRQGQSQAPLGAARPEPATCQTWHPGTPGDSPLICYTPPAEILDACQENKHDPKKKNQNTSHSCIGSSPCQISTLRAHGDEITVSVRAPRWLCSSKRAWLRACFQPCSAWTSAVATVGSAAATVASWWGDRQPPSPAPRPLACAEAVAHPGRAARAHAANLPWP